MSEQEWARLRRLEQEGVIKLPDKLPNKQWLEEFWKLPRPEDPQSLVRKALLEERGER